MTMKLRGNNFFWGVAVFVVVLALPLFIGDSRYFMNIMNLAGIFIILTYSLNYIHGYLGLISIGQAGFFAVGAYLTAGLTLGLGLNFFPALIIAAFGGAFQGY
jgi:branched-chain amino acid transport system permease protein